MCSQNETKPHTTTLTLTPWTVGQANSLTVTLTITIFMPVRKLLAIQVSCGCMCTRSCASNLDSLTAEYNLVIFQLAGTKSSQGIKPIWTHSEPFTSFFLAMHISLQKAKILPCNFLTSTFKTKQIFNQLAFKMGKFKKSSYFFPSELENMGCWTRKRSVKLHQASSFLIYWIHTGSPDWWGNSVEYISVQMILWEINILSIKAQRLLHSGCLQCHKMVKSYC